MGGLRTLGRDKAALLLFMGVSLLGFVFHDDSALFPYSTPSIIRLPNCTPRIVYFPALLSLIYLFGTKLSIYLLLSRTHTLT